MIVVFPAPFSPTSAMRSPGREREAHVPHRPALAARIPEADVLEHEALADRPPAPGARPARDVIVGCISKKSNRSLQIEALLVDVARRRAAALNQVAAARERRGEKGQRAERDRSRRPRAARMIDVRGVVAERAEDREQRC